MTELLKKHSFKIQITTVIAFIIFIAGSVWVLGEQKAVYEATDTSLQVQITDLEGRHDHLVDKYENMSADLEDIKAENNEVKVQLAEITTKLASIETLLQDLKKTVE